ncbi:hypothetical protein ACH4MY_36165 [Streptomyces sp. NPDC017246]|uniref:hypothetical protein n=1 Tax=Streptomyces sp. NPDC017246 TaxID=3364985 RepID=UPI0037AC7821
MIDLVVDGEGRRSVLGGEDDPPDAVGAEQTPALRLVQLGEPRIASCSAGAVR